MPEIIAATAAEALSAIASTPGQAAGQSVEQWLQDAQMIRQLQEMGTPKPVYNWKIDPAGDEAFSKVVDETEDALRAWLDYKQNGGKVSPGGNAAPSPTVKATPQTAMKGTGASAASAGGLLTMSLPTWTAAVAPLLGVAVGAGMYELAPEFWEKVSRTLLPFCYDGTDVMPVVTDEDGNTYVDKEAVEALKELFEAEGIGEAEVTEHTLDGDSVSTGAPPVIEWGGSYGTITWNGGEWFQMQEGGELHYVSQTPVTYTNDQGTFSNPNETIESYTYNGQTKTVDTGVSTWSLTSIVLPIILGKTISEIGKIVFEGTSESSGGYPEGTAKWEGNTVEFPTLPKIDVYTDPEDSTKTRDFIPVALPTIPGQSVDPETNPDPTTNSDPEEQIDPYITPFVPKEQFPDGSEVPDTGELSDDAPFPAPYPKPNPKPDTEADPSQPDDTPPGKLVDVLPGFDPGVDLPVPSNPSLPGPSGAGGDGGVGGLVSVYNPTYAELTSFSQWLWVTYADATIDKIWNNPFDGIISLHELYATPNKGSRKYIKSGFLVSPVDSITIPNRYTEINCGSAIFPEFYGNYLDYSPYSKALCYLPFIGIVELNVDDIVGHTVSITYHVDSYSGACIALINCVNDRSSGVLYQFSGNCSVQLPIAGGSQAAIKAAQISAGAYQNAYHIAGLAGLAGGVASGIGSLLSLNLGGVLSGAVNGIGSYMSNQAQGQAAAVSQTVSAKSSVQHSGQFGESFGAMGNKKPYMILKRPVQVQVPNYQSEYGYPAHKYVNISECTGYIRCRGVHVLSARATDSEKHMIEQALTEGVYVT